jgi:hypothetical protein
MCRNDEGPDVSTCRDPTKKKSYVWAQTGNGQGVWVLAKPPAGEAGSEEQEDPGIAEEDQERMAKGGPPPVCNGKNGEPGVHCRVARPNFINDSKGVVPRDDAKPVKGTTSLVQGNDKKEAIQAGNNQPSKKNKKEPEVNPPTPESPEEAKERMAKGGPPPICDGKNG